MWCSLSLSLFNFPPEEVEGIGQHSRLEVEYSGFYRGENGRGTLCTNIHISTFVFTFTLLALNSHFVFYFRPIVEIPPEDVESLSQLVEDKKVGVLLQLKAGREQACHTLKSER